MPSIHFSARKAFIALAAISAMAVLAYYYFGLLVPGKGSELNSRGFRILARLEQNIHEKKVNIQKTIDLFSGKSRQGIQLFDGLVLLGPDTTNERQRFKGRFNPDYDSLRNRWQVILFSGDARPLQYSYDVSRFFHEVLGFRKDFFEEYVILYGDSVIYQTRPLAYSGDTRQILDRGKKSKHKLYSDFVERDTLAGKQYYTFYHPFDRSSDIQFVLCGLVSAEKYNRDKYLLNTDQVIWISLLFLLAAFALPFVKIFTVSRFERMQHHDVIRMGVALIAGTSVASVAMLLLTYSKSEEFRHRQAVKDLNRSVQTKMTSEIGQILEEICRHEQNIENELVDYQEWICKNKVSNANVSEHVTGYFNHGDSHHYTEVLLLIDGKGTSWGGWSSKLEENPDTELAEREYVKVFTNSEDELFPYAYRGEVHGAAAEQYFVQPIYSWLDQQNMIMVSKEPHRAAKAIIDTLGAKQHSNRQEVLIMALETRLFSLMNTALPDEMNFCVVDDRGNVLFHSDDKRNLRENFIEECNKAPFLREAITGRMDTTLMVHYYGHDHYAYLAPLPGLPYTVVALYDTSFVLEALTNQVTFSISMLILLGLLILFVFIASHFLTRRLTFLKRQKVNLRWLRYNPTNLSGFKRLTVYLLVPSALSLIFFNHGNLLFISFFLPVFTLALSGAAIFVTHFRGYQRSLYTDRIVAQFRVYFGVCIFAALTLFIVLLYIYEWRASFSLWIIGIAINLLLLMLFFLPKRFVVLDRSIAIRAVPLTERWAALPGAMMSTIRSIFVRMAGSFRKNRRARNRNQAVTLHGEQAGAVSLFYVVAPMLLLLYNLSVFPARNFFLTSMRMERELMQKRNSLVVAGKVYARENWLASGFNSITCRKEQKYDFSVLTSGIYACGQSPGDLALYVDADPAVQAKAPVKQRPPAMAGIFGSSLNIYIVRQLMRLNVFFAAWLGKGKVKDGAPKKPQVNYTLMPAASLPAKDRRTPPSAIFPELYMRVVNLPNISYDAYELKGIFMHRYASAEDPGAWYWDDQSRRVKYSFSVNGLSPRLRGVSVHVPLLKNTWRWLEAEYQVLYLVLVISLVIIVYAVLQYIYRKIMLLEHFPAENTLKARRDADREYIFSNAVKGTTNLLVLSLPGTNVVEEIETAIRKGHYIRSREKSDLLKEGISNRVFVSRHKRTGHPREIILIPFFDLQTATSKNTKNPMTALARYFRGARTKVIWITSSDPCEQVSIITRNTMELYQRRARNKDQALDEIYIMEQEQENMLKVLDDFEKVYYALEENVPAVKVPLKYVEDEFRFGAYFASLRNNIVKIPATAQAPTAAKTSSIIDAYFTQDSSGWRNRYDHADERFVLKVQDLAQSYYFSIWSGLNNKEKYVLYDFAQDEITNYKNYFVLAELESKGILYFCDEEKTLKVFNKSFRNFILTVVDPQEALLLEQQVNVTGTWEIVRMVLIIFFVSIGMFLFFTEHTIFNKIVGVTTALTSLVPTIINFFANLRASKMSGS